MRQATITAIGISNLTPCQPMHLLTATTPRSLNTLFKLYLHTQETISCDEDGTARVIEHDIW